MQLKEYLNKFYVSKLDITELETIHLCGDALDGYKVNCIKCGSECIYHPYEVDVKCTFCTTENSVFDVCMGLTGLSCEKLISLLEICKNKPIPKHIKQQYLPHNPVLLEKKVKDISGDACALLKHIGCSVEKNTQNAFVIIKDPNSYKHLDNVTIDKHCKHGSLSLIWHTKNGIHLTHALKPSRPINEPAAFLKSAIAKIKNGKKHLFIASPFTSAALNLSGEASISLSRDTTPSEIERTIKLINPSMCVFINPQKDLMEQLVESETTLLTVINIREPALTKNNLENLFNRLSEDKMKDLFFYTNRQKTIFDLITNYVKKGMPAYVIRDLVKEVCELDLIIKKSEPAKK